jgi:hypothetical protein
VIAGALASARIGRAAALAATVTASACSRNLRISVLIVAVLRAAARALSDRLRSDASLFRTSGGMMKQVQGMGVLLPGWRNARQSRSWNVVIATADAMLVPQTESGQVALPQRLS